MTVLLVICLGVTTSLIIGGKYLYYDSEENIIDELEDIKIRIRRCEKDYLLMQNESTNISSKLDKLKNQIKPSNKLHDMLIILEKEWINTAIKINNFKKKQELNSMCYIK